MPSMMHRRLVFWSGVGAAGSRARCIASASDPEEVTMRRIQIVAIAVVLLLTLTATAQQRGSANSVTRVEPLPRDLEVQLALSALPPHLRDQATAYVLNPDKGFEVARKGTNGFHTFVARTGMDATRGSWPLTRYPDDILYAISFDQAGVNANMRVYFDIEEMRAKGIAPGELKRIIQERYKTGYYKAPERAGLSYMLSPVLRNYVDPDKDDSLETTNNPHVMHYAPNVSNDNVGGVTPSQSPYPFVILHGPHGYVIQHVGNAETAAITKEYEGMLARLCSINRLWCLQTSNSQ
jgi:hypothetical protein